MPPRAVLCELCGGKFFRSSLAIHQKTCRTKVGVQMHDCPYCHVGVPMLEMDLHVMRCPEAKAAGARPTGASAALAKRLETSQQRVESGIPHPSEVKDSQLHSGNSGWDAPSEYGHGDDVRIACAVCGRRFNMDRVTKHQAICEKIKSKGPRPEFQVQRSYMEGGSEGTCIGVAAGVPTGRGKGSRGRRVAPGETGLINKPFPPPCKSKWREASLSWRKSIRDSRANPLPRWGKDSGSYGRRGGQTLVAAHGFPSPSRPGRSSQARNGCIGGGFSPVAYRGPRARSAAEALAATDGFGRESRYQRQPRVRQQQQQQQQQRQERQQYQHQQQEQQQRLQSRDTCDRGMGEFGKLDISDEANLCVREFRSLMMTGNQRMPNAEDCASRAKVDEFVDLFLQDPKVLSRLPTPVGLDSSSRCAVATSKKTCMQPWMDSPAEAFSAPKSAIVMAARSGGFAAGSAAKFVRQRSMRSKSATALGMGLSSMAIRERSVDAGVRRFGAFDGSGCAFSNSSRIGSTYGRDCMTHAPASVLGR
eukprot:TRINITY_DN17546_c0_g1_i1.p1 TRINITY_DN17546_c0_g1~~TRINITY_DN17546_c0_g1_i1.p1  ORF type:complete len:533 (-),score=90.12 TRINITY_DN17546_c0_g1_i1:252-1850(-)